MKEVDPDTEYADGTGLGGAVWVRELKVTFIERGYTSHSRAT